VLQVTVDTNILISGLNFRRGKPFQLLEFARAGKIDLAVSDPILDEMEDVLRRKFGWTNENIVEARERITAMARIVKPATTLNVIKDDPTRQSNPRMCAGRGLGLHRHPR
jgi:putative PIN family toxin of toxin-antitoxin system